MMNELLEKAMKLAGEVHKEQTDKAGKPYIFHLMRVAERCDTDEEKIVALLHDVIEDTELTAQNLLDEGFPPLIVDAVLSLTRNDGEDYMDFVERAALNPIARSVKMHDLEDNMDITRLERLEEKDLARLNKYLRAYSYLKSL
ncbi:MAG: HD domain-containing protein [Bacteroidales bacterium]|nr:HD domain-containing protein [Bacteroidales bacterium]